MLLIWIRWVPYQYCLQRTQISREISYSEAIPLAGESALVRVLKHGRSRSQSSCMSHDGIHSFWIRVPEEGSSPQSILTSERSSAQGMYVLNTVHLYRILNKKAVSQQRLPGRSLIRIGWRNSFKLDECLKGDNSKRNLFRLRPRHHNKH